MDIVPGAPLRKTDRQRFLRSIALQCGDSHGGSKGAATKAWVCRAIGSAAYEMPLPPRWTEQVDARGYIYFSHALRTEATWEHPLNGAIRETIQFALAIVNAEVNLGEAAGAVKTHLRQVQDRAAAELKDWTGPYREPQATDEFFHNEVTGESTWESPLEAWQYELHARYWLLVQLLQNLHMHYLLKDERSGSSASSSPNAANSTTPTPRFPARHSPSGAQPPPPLDDDHSNAFSLLESTLSTSGLSAAVRSHASEIASSLASSAPSFGADAKCSIKPTPCALKGEFAARPRPPAQPPPPKKPPPPLRHLAVPPRATDVPPEQFLRVESPCLYVGAKAHTGASPPPPPGCSRPTAAGMSPMQRVPPPPPPRKLNLPFNIDELEPEPPDESPEQSARSGYARNSLESPPPPASAAGRHDKPAGVSSEPGSPSMGPATQIQEKPLKGASAPFSSPPKAREDPSERCKSPVFSTSQSEDGWAARRPVKKRSTLASFVCVVA